MTSILRILPVETLSDIIDAVAEIDKEPVQNYTRKILPFANVRACSQTCRTFVPLCRKHIFKNVQFQVFNSILFCSPIHGSRMGDPSPATTFLDLLVKTPEIARYVKTLTLTSWIVLREQGHQVAHRASLLSVIQKLSGLATVKVFGNLGTLGFNWKDVLDALQPVLFSLMSLPTLTRLDVYGFKNFNLSILSHCTALRTLNLQSVTLGNLDEPSNILLSDPIKLAHFGLHRCSTNLLPLMFSQKHGNPIFSSERLVTLRMMMVTTADVDLTTTFFLGAPRVESVKFWISGQARTENAIEAITPCLETLKHLSLEVSYGVLGVPNLSGIFQPLPKFLSRSNLDYLDITINLCGCFYDEWNELEKVLRAPGLSYLKRVSLKVTVHYSTDDPLLEEDLQRLKDLLQNQLRHLDASKSLNFNLVVEGMEEFGIPTAAVEW